MLKFKSAISLLIAVTFALDSQSKAQETEPDFIYEGYVLQGDNDIQFTAFVAHLSKYMDWGHNQENAIRIKEKGKAGSVQINKDEPFKVAIRTGSNSVSPSQVFSVIPFKVKKKERHIDFIGFIPRQTSINSSNTTYKNVNGNVYASTMSGTTFTAMPSYEDRFPESCVRVSGKKMGSESYILKIPALETGEYALCFKNGNNEIMIIDISVN